MSPRINLSNLFHPDDLEQAIAAGHVRTNLHPDHDLVIYNYTEAAQFERAWTPVTRQCRGLICDNEGWVLARPFPKCHNHNEPEAYTFAANEPVQVTDKVDGSLAIGYPVDGRYAIATRGSFSSDQAKHATEVWNTRYAGHVDVPGGVTPLWEIIYPANRIVVDYNGMDDLVLLGGIEIATGKFVDAADLATEMNWTGPVVEEFPHARFSDALAAAPRPGREGYVIRSLLTGHSVKYKYDEYVRLHRIVTGMNARVVWEHLGAGKPVSELIEPLPDEFHRWVEDIAAELTHDAEMIRRRANHLHNQIIAGLPEGWTRKDYALTANEKGGTLRPWLFNLLDGRDPWDGIWKTLRPSGAVTMTGQSEEEEAA